jgi:hypothetical protein
MPESNAVDIIKAAQTAAEAECNHLAAQLRQSEKFANELRPKLYRAQVRHEHCKELLATLEPSAPAEPIIDTVSGCAIPPTPAKEPTS